MNNNFPIPDEVIHIGLVKTTAEELPAVLVASTDGLYLHTITNGFEIHLCNEFLKLLNCEIDIKFKSYRQYSKLLMRINDVIKGASNYERRIN